MRGLSPGTIGELSCTDVLLRHLYKNARIYIVMRDLVVRSHTHSVHGDGWICRGTN